MYIALVLLASIIAAGAVEYHSTRSVADDVLAAVESAEQATGGDTSQRCREASELWYERKSVLQLFLPHPDIDAVDTAVEKLVVYADIGDEVNTTIYLTELKERMYALKDGEEISVFNFM